MKLKRTQLAISLLCCLFLGVAASGFAQTPGAIDQVDANQQRRAQQAAAQDQIQADGTAPEIYPGESSDVGPQSVLSLKPRRTWVEGIVDSEYLHTDNVFLDHSFRQPSGVLISTAEIALAPSAFDVGGGQLTPRVGFSQQWYDFFQDHHETVDLDNFDFNAQTIFTDARWTRNNWIFGAGFDYTRLMTTKGYSQFYAEYVPRWEAQRIFAFNPKNNLTLAYQGYYHFTDTSSSVFRQPQDSFYDRLDEALLATYNFYPCSHALVQPYYIFKYTHFTATIHRNDYLNSVGLAVYGFMCRSFSCRAFVGFDQRNSSLTLAEYHQFSPGGGLNFNIRF